ncbi:hypothetical protein J3Q64DRAFT_1852064 [Phycomyces blakesleeanus]|uniref:Uncharacterized protein n=1 Tax=Phycomyces blakesleeanus TaxID=4837 RepID=A0ABR3APL6_PHYBL
MFSDDGNGNIIDYRDQQAPTFVDGTPFRSKIWTDLQKCIKNDVQLEWTTMNAAVMGKDASATIQDTVDNLTTNFISLQIKKSRVAEVMSEEWNLIIKDISRHPLGTNKEESLQARVNWIDYWLEESLTAIDTILVIGIDLSTREIVGATKRKALQNRLSAPKVIDPIIMKRDYTPVYLPLITCLTLIQSEKSWAIVKGNIKRNKSSGIESFAMHIIEASKAVPVENLRGSIQHFVN